MMQETGQFTSNGRSIFYREWAIETPKALFVIVHGLGEHSGRYQHVSEFLNSHGYAVAALDHQGHGQSDGQKGHVASFEDYHSDLANFINQQKDKYSNLEIHLLGHSMGGLIATGYVLRNSDIKSVIISAPPYGVPGLANRIQLNIGAFLGRFLKTTSLDNKIDPKIVCSTQSVVDDYVADPLVHSLITLAWGRAFIQEQKFIHNNIQNLQIPSLFLIPEKDELTDPSVSVACYEEIQFPDKAIHLYPDSFHEVLNEEVDGPRALQHLINWLEA